MLGRFMPSKSKVFKILFVVMALTSFSLNYILAKKIWNVTCADGGGYFITKIECNEISQAKFDSREYYRLQLNEALAKERQNYGIE